MALPILPADVVAFLAALNGNPFDATSNPEGLADGGHRPNFPLAMNGTAEMANYFADLGTFLVALASQVTTDANSAAAGSGTEASVATIRAAADVAHYISMRRAVAAQAPVAVPFAAPLELDLGGGINFTTPLTGNTVLANFLNKTPGKSGFIDLVQDATGGRAITSYGSNFVWIGYPPVWSLATANKIVKIGYFVASAGQVQLSFAGMSQ